MRFSFYSLKTGILTYLAFLILCAMFLLNVVMIRFAERDLIKAKIHAGRLLLDLLGKSMGNEPFSKHKGLTGHDLDSAFGRDFSRMLTVDYRLRVLMINKQGIKVFSVGLGDEEEKEAISLSRRVLGTGKWTFDFRGSTWGVIWLAPKRVNVAVPVLSEGHLIGVMTLCDHLGPLYQGLRNSEKIVLIYILLNAIILVIVGMYLLSRTVVRPIHKLLRITEEFKGGESFAPLVGTSRNEIGQLSRSLNMMLKRLDENKRDLESHIASLERANLEIRKAQDEMVMSEKLTSVGRLSSGVAHEIGNPIGIVLGYLELLRSGNLDEQERQDFLSRIESEITRINQTIRQLLDYSRPATGEAKPVHIHQMIKETMDMLKPQPMMAHVELRMILEAEKDIILADANQLKQVFLNIAMNAADALADKGTSGERALSSCLTIRTTNTGNSIIIRFNDTGYGIPHEDLVRIFDPFYTTKDPGKGTGLGLSVCYKIITGLGGSIGAESTFGKCTTIIIDIPLWIQGCKYSDITKKTFIERVKRELNYVAKPCSDH
jgi:two-component system NtrC family sensor kinase